MNTHTPKACELCASDRIRIGKSYGEIPAWRRAVGVVLIYVPVVLFPFVIVIAGLTRLSLWVLGAQNLKRYRDFVPAQSSHRYRFNDQIVMKAPRFLPHLGWRIFWQFNCNYYCPLSVALFEYQTYLVKAVENWWCPFFHARKAEYAAAPLDQSYWHAKSWETDKLHADDRESPIWNEDSPLVQLRAKGSEGREH